MGVNSASASLRIGVDVGGTFTDLVAMDGTTGAVWHHKERSSPDKPSRAILQGTERLLHMAACNGQDVAFFGHGTTVITNMILERQGARVALVTTQGFRDVLDLGRQARPHVYDYRIRRPRSLVARRDRFELPERIAADGSVVTPLDEEALSDLCDTLARGGYEAVAVCFLHGYRAPGHEALAVETLRARLDGVFVTASHAVAPEYREYERFATTALNAFVGPRAARYFSALETGLRDLGIKVPLYTVTSNAGLLDSETVRRVPIRTALSGPAAGVGGIGRILAAHDLGDIVTFDVGGTSTDIAILPGGAPRTARARSVSGHPVLAPMVDIDVIGAGGGSIARLDRGGALVVGPQSAGADPGPAAYGRGGQSATLTDAAVALGRIRPGRGRVGDLALDRDAAHAAILRAVGDPLGLDAAAAAQGILEIASASMARTIRSAALSRGVEPERLTLVAFGGAGPLLGADVADALGIGRMVVPDAPGTLCARAILVADIARDFSTTRLMPLAEATADDLCAAFSDMRTVGADWLDAEGVTQAVFETVVDCRYVGQNFEIAIPVDADTPDPSTLRTDFDAAHGATQGFSLPDRPVEVVTFRLKARAARTEDLVAARREAPTAEPERRSVFFAGRWQETSIHLREALCPGSRLTGPAVIEEATATTVVPPAWNLRVLGDGTLDITRDAERGT
jgi:N-methylhydantoinase A